MGFGTPDLREAKALLEALHALADYAFGPHNLVTAKVRKWHTSDSVIMRREGRIIGLERTRIQWARTAALDPEEIRSPSRSLSRRAHSSGSPRIIAHRFSPSICSC